MLRGQDHASHETLELAERESSIDWTFGPDRNRGDGVGPGRTLGADARSLLGGNRDSGRNAIESGRYAHASIERVVATALGASVGAIEANYFGSNLVAFVLAIFFIGLLSFGFRLEKTAYRYASVTLTIIVLIPRTNPAWIVGVHRFIEVSVGIIVALVVVALWPERSPVSPKRADE
jgi:Predicted membrane protein